MHYIQRYKISERADCLGVDRFLQGDYMGSTEFETGSIQKSWKYLRQEKVGYFTHEVQSKGGAGTLVKFYVITTELGFERFKHEIDVHLDGTRIGRVAKEWTNLWEKFNAKDPIGMMPDAWLAADGFVSHSSWDDNTKLNTDHPPVFFTDNLRLSRRVFLELNRANSPVKSDELRIGDMVMTYDIFAPVRVCGLNSDDTISVRPKYGKARKYQAADVFPAEYVQQILE